MEEPFVIRSWYGPPYEWTHVNGDHGVPDYGSGHGFSGIQNTVRHLRQLNLATYEALTLSPYGAIFETAVGTFQRYSKFTHRHRHTYTHASTLAHTWCVACAHIMMFENDRKSLTSRFETGVL
ncbi:hypothetical protein EVAR_97558_1 [Eumeta japonica]|uniref:Uncharacterized protein n=1 Tax=Eumeta variegata TaxID=151549 RepID=A0A4C1WS55_EUMVA|nr:hypothetical protein EVAR_97558_1 [Eumeta japonica]